MRKILLTFLILGLISCKTDKSKESKNSTLENEKSGTVENLKSEGELDENDKPIGVWKYYDENNQIQRIEEYISIEGEAFLNQDWHIKPNGDTIIGKSNFYKLKLEKDTIKISEPTKAKIDLIAPYFKDKYSETYVVIPKDHSVNFNDDFSNIEDVEKDTIYNLNFKPELKKSLGLKTNWGKTVIFGRYFNETGQKKLRGILVEYNINDSIKENSGRQNYWTMSKYFEREIIVTE